MRLTDYIVKRLSEHGVKQVFTIPGGGAMYLNDSLAANRDIQFVCNHHEQACAIAAEGYARASNQLGFVVVTSGPGGTNALTGVACNWLDSIPVLYISGQIKIETSIESCRELGLRQLGDQELNIIDVVRPITKFASLVRDPKQIKFILDKAVFIATHGRPGPVWLDIPLDVQGAEIDEDALVGYDAGENGNSVLAHDDVKPLVAEVVSLIKQSVRPIFLAGHGIRLAHAQELFIRLVEKIGIPVVSSFNGIDLIDTEHPLYVGRIGTLGGRAGNFALQNSDLLISVGSRNNIRQVSYNWRTFARAAKKVFVDIDPAELKKPTVIPDLAICMDAGVFLRELESQVEGSIFPQIKEWRQWCLERKKRFPTVTQTHREHNGSVNLYYFIETLTHALDESAVVVAGNGSACVGLFQAAIVKKGQRMFWNSGCATMGYDLPAAIGACMARNKKDVVCVAGDGGLQMNIQELQTIVYHNLPIKIFYLNNGGYISMRQTQKSFFNGRLMACDETSGVSFPDIIKVAKAYGISTACIEDHHRMPTIINDVLGAKSAVLCEVKLPRDYIFEPKLSSVRKADGSLISKPLEDLSPLLSRKEFEENMLIPVLQE